MQWEDEGFLLSKKKYNENSVIVEVFTLNHGKCSGIVYGGTSRKIKNYIQLGNKIYINSKTKKEGKLGYFKIEIIDTIGPLFFDDNKKMNCLLSTLTLLNEVLPELHSYKIIYNLVSDFFHELKFNNDWIIYYIFWEINLIREIGFDMNLKSNYIQEANSKNNLVKVNIDNQRLEIPKFLIEKKIVKVKKESIYLALKFTGKFIEKNILIPNNLNYPRKLL